MAKLSGVNLPSHSAKSPPRSLFLLESVWIPSVAYCAWTSNLSTPVLLSILVFQVIINYGVAIHDYHYSHTALENESCRLPPTYPSLIPSLAAFAHLLWDHSRFLTKIGSYKGKPTASHIPLLGGGVFFFNDRQTIECIFKQSSLSSPISVYCYMTSYLFGMGKKSHAVYSADDSGLFRKPHHNSKVPAEGRVDYVTHRSLLGGFTGPGLQPTTVRFLTIAAQNLESLNITEDWVDMPDFAQFFRDMIGSSTLQSILGPTLLKINPSFVRDLWQFDKDFPTFSMGLPGFLIPRQHKNREGLICQIKSWYKYAREHFDESLIDANGDGDPVWGCSMMRVRQDTILKLKDHDDEALARVDLGLAWASIGNVVLSSMFAAFHMFKDPELLAQVRASADKQMGDLAIDQVDHRAITNDPVLSSLYAETLRLYVKIYSIFVSPHEDVPLGKWWLPKKKAAFLNSATAQMDTTFWNTQNGKHPVDTFWAQRFIVNPADDTSGPINPSCRKDSAATTAKMETGKPFFTMEGCEGSWIPYGGGHSVCPGRFLAKSVITMSCAMLAKDYDVELHESAIKFTNRRFGFGVGEIKGTLPFRIRKRDGRVDTTSIHSSGHLK